MNTIIALISVGILILLITDLIKNREKNSTKQAVWSNIISILLSFASLAASSTEQIYKNLGEHEVLVISLFLIAGTLIILVRTISTINPKKSIFAQISKKDTTLILNKVLNAALFVASVIAIIIIIFLMNTAKNARINMDRTDLNQKLISNIQPADKDIRYIDDMSEDFYFELFKNNDETDSQYVLPSIDFTFSNTGDTVGIIVSADLEILNLRVDPHPTFVFTYEVFYSPKNDELFLSESETMKTLHKIEKVIFYVENYGYGNAIDCNFSLQSEYLKKDIKDKSVEKVAIGDKIILFEITPSDFLESKDVEGQSFSHALENIKIKCDYKNIHNEVAEFEPSRIDNEDYVIDRYSYLVFYKDSIYFYYLVADGRGPIDILNTYVSYLDVDDVIDKDFPHRINYTKLHRDLKSEDVEAFTFMLGASKSCNIEYKLIFHLNNGKSIESEPFQSYIFNPPKPKEPVNIATPYEHKNRILQKNEAESYNIHEVLSLQEYGQDFKFNFEILKNSPYGRHLIAEESIDDIENFFDDVRIITEKYNVKNISDEEYAKLLEALLIAKYYKYLFPAPIQWSEVFIEMEANIGLWEIIVNECVDIANVYERIINFIDEDLMVENMYNPYEEQVAALRKFSMDLSRIDYEFSDLPSDIWKKVYMKKILEHTKEQIQNHTYSMSLFDINIDGIPELFLKEIDEHTEIYTCINGVLVPLKYDNYVGFGEDQFLIDYPNSIYVRLNVPRTSAGLILEMIEDKFVVREFAIIDGGLSTSEYNGKEASSKEVQNFFDKYDGNEWIPQYVISGNTYKIAKKIIDNYKN